MFAVRIGLVDDPGERKIHDKRIPLAGGLAVMTGIALPLVMGTIFFWSGQSGLDQGAQPANSSVAPAYLLSHGLHRRLVELAGIVLGGCGMLMLGLLDDRHELGPAQKFGGQLIIAFLVAATGVRISLFVPNLFFQYSVTLLWILTLINALNFMDNMNGLCAGVGCIAALQFGLLSAFADQYLVAIIAFVSAGALAGFLPFNYPRASVFLGDSGSHLVGYLLAVLAILPHFYSTRTSGHVHSRWAVLAPLLVLAVPLLDLCRVVVLRTLNRQPFWIGDTNHLSHRLVRSGCSRTQAVAFLWAAAAVIGALAFLL